MHEGEILHGPRYSDPDMDALFNQARGETDNAARAAIFNQIFTKAQDEAIYAVLCNPLLGHAFGIAAFQP